MFKYQRFYINKKLLNITSINFKPLKIDFVVTATIKKLIVLFQDIKLDNSKFPSKEKLS